MRQKLGQKMRQLLMLTMLFSSVGLSGQMFSAQNASVESTDTNTYVVIGTQTWMKYNLKVTKYNDGTGIPKVTDNAAWSALTTPAYCWYNNDSATYAVTYGALYNWYAVNTGKLCPTGWHEPSKTEWETLINYVDGWEVAGGKLKEVGTTHWISPNTDATDIVGFRWLPNGFRNNDGNYYNINNRAYAFTSTSYNSTDAWWIETYYNTANANVRNDGVKKYGLSVRCIKD